MSKTEAASAEGSDPDRIGWLRQMLEIRLFEEKVQELFMQGAVQGTTHLCQGQEAVCVGAVSAMSPQDYLTITYRGHGQALARGMPTERAFGELDQVGTLGDTTNYLAHAARVHPAIEPGGSQLSGLLPSTGELVSMTVALASP